MLSALWFAASHGVDTLRDVSLEIGMYPNNSHCSWVLPARVGIEQLRKILQYGKALCCITLGPALEG